MIYSGRTETAMQVAVASHAAATTAKSISGSVVWFTQTLNTELAVPKTNATLFASINQLNDRTVRFFTKVINRKDKTHKPKGKTLGFRFYFPTSYWVKGLYLMKVQYMVNLLLHKCSEQYVLWSLINVHISSDQQ